MTKSQRILVLNKFSSNDCCACCVELTFLKEKGDHFIKSDIEQGISSMYEHFLQMTGDMSLLVSMVLWV